jgi:hypothetical protein
MFARPTLLLLLFLFAALSRCDGRTLSNAGGDNVKTEELRGGGGGGGGGRATVGGGGAGTEPSDEARAGRDLAPACPPLPCVPTVHLATPAQASAAGGAEANYYAALDDGPLVCQRDGPTVMQLAGLSPCPPAIIGRVQFVLLYNGGQIRGFTETEAPYTVFGNNATWYGSRLLRAGPYSLSVTVRTPQNCRAYSQAFPFTVVNCPPTSVPSGAPIASSPQPSHRPSSSPQPSMRPSHRPSFVRTEEPTPF